MTKQNQSPRQTQHETQRAENHPRDDLKAFLDNELTPLRRVSVRMHIARCAQCRKEIHAMTQITQEMQQETAQTESQTATLAPDLRARILTGIEATNPAQPDAQAEPDAKADARPNASRVLMPPRRAPLWAWGAIAASVLMFGAASTSLMRQSGSPAGQTVFNSANNALSTSTSGDDAVYDSTTSDSSASTYKRLPSAGPVAAPGAASGGVVTQQLRESRNEAGAMRGGLRGNDFNRTMRTRASGSAGASAGAVDAASGATSSPTFADNHVRNLARSTTRSIAEDALSPQRSVYKEASITVEVSDLEKQTDEVERMVKNAGGFIADNDLQTASNGLRRSQMLVKVPAAQFETMLKTVGALGIVKNKKVNGEDITARLSDARQAKLVLTNQLQAQVERLKKARVKDKAQERYEARQIQIQVAQARARFNILNRLATLSTMTVQLREKTAPAAASQSGFVEELGKTRNAAMASFMVAARMPLMLLMWILAYSPLWIPLLIAWRIALHYSPRRTP